MSQVFIQGGGTELFCQGGRSFDSHRIQVQVQVLVLVLVLVLVMVQVEVNCFGSFRFCRCSSLFSRGGCEKCTNT